MATCYICGKSHAEYRRTVQTGNSNRMGVSSRGRTSTSTTVHYGVRSVCAKCALNIDYKNKKNKGAWGFVLGAFLFGLSIFICFVHGEYFNLGIFGVALGISFCIVPYYISCKKADIWYKENCDKYFDEYDLRQQIKSNTKNELKAKTGFFHSIPNLFNSWSGYSFNNYYSDAFSPDEFKRTLGTYNPQFRRFEANDSKDLILYLLQTMHEELNYFGNKNQRLKYMPNQYNYYETYQHFTTNYNANNFSKISLLFYGTYISTTTCKKCGTVLFNFQKFKFISFGMIKYHRNKFNILNGFEDNSRPTTLEKASK